MQASLLSRRRDRSVPEEESKADADSCPT